jgi:pimeloyl-ACP methyl ester carboxylesterase
MRASYRRQGSTFFSTDRIIRTRTLAWLCTLLLATLDISAEPSSGLPAEPVRHASVSLGGVEIFYREAGPRDAPGLLLLHGFPSSSFMFRHLLPALGDRWRVVAPDYPGFGASDFPSPETFDYTFANLAAVVGDFTDAIRLDTYAIYIQDYGAPIGLRLALERPERVTALIVQNGNAYAEGLSPAWDPLKTYWSEPSAANRERLREWLTAEGIREQYVAGVPEALVERLSPDTWTVDWLRLTRPGNIDVQLDLFGDYASNVALYPQIQALLRAHQWPTLVVWGRFDPFFTVDGARAYTRDAPEAAVHLLDAGHFALETHWPQIAALMRDFLAASEIARSRRPGSGAF